MKIEELEARLVEISALRDELKQEARSIALQIDQLRAQEAAERSHLDTNPLTQSLQTSGIPGGEAFGRF